MFLPKLAALAILPLIFSLGWVIFQRLRRPSCRVCLFRRFCPNRELEYYEPTRNPCWNRSQTMDRGHPNEKTKLD